MATTSSEEGGLRQERHGQGQTGQSKKGTAPRVRDQPRERAQRPGLEQVGRHPGPDRREGRRAAKIQHPTSLIGPSGKEQEGKKAVYTGQEHPGECGPKPLD